MQKLRGGLNFLTENSLFLIGGALFGLLWANIDYYEYHHFVEYWHLHFLINDVAMAAFFLLAGKEIREATLPGGSLSSLKVAALPLCATAGGVLVPLAVYMIGSAALDPDIFKGWAVPTATDIAFSAMVARFIFGRHPAVTFLLLLAVADDAVGLVLIAIFYPQETFNPMAIGWVLAGMGIAGSMWKGFKIRSFWPYLAVAAPMLWLGFYEAGFHPALALVPLAWCMPHEKSDEGIFEELDSHSHRRDALNRMEHFLMTPVAVMLGIFGFVNAGVEITGFALGAWLVLVSLVLGKPLGIYLLSKAGMIFVNLRLAEGMKEKELVVIGSVAGIGFTVALFVAGVAFPEGETQSALKMGALGSILSAPLSIILALLLRVGRFAPSLSVAPIDVRVNGHSSEPISSSEEINIREKSGSREV